jgi:hypothetical protein
VVEAAAAVAAAVAKEQVVVVGLLVVVDRKIWAEVTNPKIRQRNAVATMAAVDDEAVWLHV